MNKIKALCCQLNCDFTVGSDNAWSPDDGYYKMSYYWKIEGPARGMSNSVRRYKTLDDCIAGCIEWMESLVLKRNSEDSV